MNKLTKQLLPFCSLIFIISLWTFLRPDTFLTAQNFLNVLRRSSVNGIMAAGMTFIIISAGIDLSVGSMMALCGMSGALVMLLASGGAWTTILTTGAVELTAGGMLLGVLAGVVAGALCGALNGGLITRLKLAPFIVTLGTMSIFRGICYLLNDNKPFAVSAFRWFDNFSVLGVPLEVLLLILVFALAGILLKYTPFGRYTYAIGSNPETSFHAGINVNRVLLAIYMFAGALTGLAGMIATSRASSAQPTAGISLELDVIAAVIIGGASPAGGRGSLTGTAIGTLLVGFLRNGLTILGVSTNFQLVVIGVIIIAAVTADQLATRRRA